MTLPIDIVGDITNLGTVIPPLLTISSGITSDIDWTYMRSPDTTVLDRLTEIERRLCIISSPNEDLLHKYPALREAYEHYKLIEKLVGETNDS